MAAIIRPSFSSFLKSPLWESVMRHLFLVPFFCASPFLLVRGVSQVSGELLVHIQLPGILLKGLVKLVESLLFLERGTALAEIWLFSELIEIEAIT